MEIICKYCRLKIPRRELKNHIKHHEDSIKYVKNFKNPSFKCVEGCEAPCCKSFPVLLTAGDMIRISKFLDISIKELITNHCRFTVLGFGFGSPIIECGFQLKPPCSFFNKNLCVINKVKPLNCRAFPESDFLYLKMKADNQVEEDVSMESSIASNKKRPELLCFKKSHNFDEENLKYNVSFTHLCIVEKMRTGRILKIQNKQLFNSVIDYLQQEVNPEVLDDSRVMQAVMRELGINDGIWKEYKNYFLELVGDFENRKNICLI